MENLRDKVLLCALASTIFMGVQFTGTAFVGMLMMLSLILLAVIFEQQWLFVLFLAAACVLTYFFPWLTLFLPIWTYDISYKRWWLLSCTLGIGLFLLPVSGAGVSIALFVCCLLTFVLGERTRLKEAYFTKNRQLADRSESVAILSKKHSQDLEMQKENEVVLARLSERNRISKDIHDGVGHILSSSLLQLGAIVTVNKDPNLKEALTTLRETLDDGMNSIRSSVHGLYGDSFSLRQEVQKVCDQFVFCELKLDYNLNQDPDAKLKMTLLFVLKEALNNVAKHSNATLVYVNFQESPANVKMLIQDNGTANQSTDPGIGLANMEERVQANRGIFYIRREAGYRIFVSLPKEESQ